MGAGSSAYAKLVACVVAEVSSETMEAAGWRRSWLGSQRVWEAVQARRRAAKRRRRAATPGAGRAATGSRSFARRAAGNFQKRTSCLECRRARGGGASGGVAPPPLPRQPAVAWPHASVGHVCLVLLALLMALQPCRDKPPTLNTSVMSPGRVILAPRVCFTEAPPDRQRPLFWGVAPVLARIHGLPVGDSS